MLVLYGRSRIRVSHHLHYHRQVSRWFVHGRTEDGARNIRTGDSGSWPCDVRHGTAWPRQQHDEGYTTLLDCRSTWRHRLGIAALIQVGYEHEVRLRPQRRHTFLILDVVQGEKDGARGQAGHRSK